MPWSQLVSISIVIAWLLSLGWCSRLSRRLSRMERQRLSSSGRGDLRHHGEQAWHRPRPRGEHCAIDTVEGELEHGPGVSGTPRAHHAPDGRAGSLHSARGLGSTQSDMDCVPQPIEEDAVTAPYVPAEQRQGLEHYSLPHRAGDGADPRPAHRHPGARP